MQTKEEGEELLDNAVSFLAVSELCFSEAFSFEVCFPCPKDGPSSAICCNILTLVFSRTKKQKTENKNKLSLAGSKELLMLLGRKSFSQTL